MDTNELIKKRRQELNLTLEDVADYVGVGKSTVRKWEIGMIENMRRDNMVRLAAVLEISPLDLLSDELKGEIFVPKDMWPDLDEEDRILNYLDFQRNIAKENRMFLEVNEEGVPSAYARVATVEVYQNVSCGTGTFVDDEIIDTISLPESMLNPRKKYFAQYAEGNSMLDAEIHDGDLLIFEKTQSMENGQIGCFCVDDGVATCKKFYKDDNTGVIMLQAANTKFQPIVITEDTESFGIIGKLALVIQKRV